MWRLAGSQATVAALKSGKGTKGEKRAREEEDAYGRE